MKVVDHMKRKLFATANNGRALQTRGVFLL